MGKHERNVESTESDDESGGFLNKLKKGAIKWGIIIGIGAVILAAI